MEGSSPDFELRAELAKLTLDHLQHQLQDLDPAAYSQIDHNNPARLRRAIEKASQ